MSLKVCDYGSILARLLVDWSSDDLTSQLSEVDSAIARLSERSRELREQINAKKPFFSLPAEIISEISMMACSPVYKASDLDDFVMSTQPTTPFNLGKTCRTWRHTVWASPRCWNIIFLDLQRNAETYQVQVALLEGWLARSGDLPLSIHLDELEAELEQWARNPPTEVFNLFSRYSHRWLHVSTFLVDPCWKQLEKFPLPLLTSLAVGPPANIQQAAGNGASWRISDAPLLRNAYITVFHKEIILPTHQLTQITLESMVWRDCLSIISECAPKLVHCALPDLKPELVHGTTPATFNLHCLSSFSASCPHTGEYSPVLRILDCITAPALSRMQLQYDGISGTEPLMAVRDFLSRSSCSLCELSLHLVQYMHQNEPSLIALLADMEKLEKLELICEMEGMSDLILDHLNPARPQRLPRHLPAAQILLPNLRGFHYNGLMEFELGTLVDMIDMRYRMAKDSEERLGLQSEGDRNLVAKPAVFNINVLEVVPSGKRASLLASAETLERLRKEHSGTTWSFSDEMGRARVYISLKD